MPFLSLEFNLESLRKLAERGLSKEDVLSLFRADQVSTGSPVDPS